MIHDKIYKLAKTGAKLVWYAETEGGKYRTISGQIDGKLTTTEWTVTEPKNTGKANATTAEEQALAEVKAMYKKRLAKDYSATLEEIEEKKYFEPMLCANWKDSPVTTGSVFVQPKLDGIRCIAKADGLWTRNGKRHLNVPHIEEVLKPIFEQYPDAIFDGELYNHHLNDDFNHICSLIKKTVITSETIEESRKFIQYHVYDMLLSEDDKTLFKDRWPRYKEVLSSFDTQSYIKAVQCDEVDFNIPLTDMKNIHDSYAEKGYEGIIIRKNAPYKHGRTKDILKMKEFITEEFILVDVSEGIGNWTGYAKRAEFVTADGKPFKAGIKGNRDFCKDILDNKENYIGTKCTVKYLNLTPAGIPRHGTVIEFDRKDI